MNSVESLVFSILIWVIVGAITATLAKGRGRDPYFWFFIGAILGIFGLLALYILPIIKTNGDAPAPSVGCKIVEEIPPLPGKLYLLKDWHCIDTSKVQQGPLSYDALKALWIEGKLLPRSYVWTEGMATWLPIEQIPDLYEDLNG